MVGQGGGGGGRRGEGGGREPAVGRGAASLGLVVRLVAQRVALGDRGQVPHGEREVRVLLVFDGQTGELTRQARGALDPTLLRWKYNTRKRRSS